MELLEGCSVSQLRRQHGRLNVRDAAMLCRQVCAGLAYAHSCRIVHRDIKPGNLFLTHDRIVKIMDFGLAKILEEVKHSSTVNFPKGQRYACPLGKPAFAKSCDAPTTLCERRTTDSRNYRVKLGETCGYFWLSRIFHPRRRLSR